MDRKKKIRQVQKLKDGKVIKTYKSVSDAVYDGHNKNSIYTAIYKKCQVLGFYWRYVEEN